MKPVIQIMPIALILAAAVVAVWRGFGGGSDPTVIRPKARRKWKWWD